MNVPEKKDTRPPIPILDGYSLHRRIGTGGVGEVWLVSNPLTDEYKALKLWHNNEGEEAQRERDALLNYARHAHTLIHENIVPIHHVGEYNGRIYYIMPLADSLIPEDNPSRQGWQPSTMYELLDSHYRQKTWLGATNIIALMLPISKAVAAIDECNMLHRDIKPENILFINKQPMLCDIGLLRRQTKDVTYVGTPGYAPPLWYLEDGGHFDVWSLAATLYTLLTGNLPDKMGQTDKLWPISGGQYQLARKDRRKWPKLHSLVFRATSDDNAERIRNPKAFADELARLTKKSLF